MTLGQLSLQDTSTQHEETQAEGGDPKTIIPCVRPPTSDACATSTICTVLAPLSVVVNMIGFVALPTSATKSAASTNDGTFTMCNLNCVAVDCGTRSTSTATSFADSIRITLGIEESMNVKADCFKTEAYASCLACTTFNDTEPSITPIPTGVRTSTSQV